MERHHSFFKAYWEGHALSQSHKLSLSASAHPCPSSEMGYRGRQDLGLTQN